jgi:hypothetical protein
LSNRPADGPKNFVDRVEADAADKIGAIWKPGAG